MHICIGAPAGPAAASADSFAWQLSISVFTYRIKKVAQLQINIMPAVYHVDYQ